MVVLRRTLQILAVLLASAVVVAYLLPANLRVTRSAVVEAEPRHVHAFVGDLKAWPQWTIWSARDPSMRIEYGTRTSGVGAYRAWNGESGEGVLTISRADPETGIAYEVSFGDDERVFESEILYRPADEGTRVVWVMRGELGANPIARFAGLGMDAEIGAEFEESLSRLAERAESRAAEERLSRESAAR